MIYLSLKRVTLPLICAALGCNSHEATVRSAFRGGVQSDPPAQNHACPLPEWLNDFTSSELVDKPGVSFITEALGDARLNTTAGNLMVLNGGDSSEDGPLVLFDCSQRKSLVFLHIPKNAGTSIESIAKMHAMFWGANRIRARNALEKQTLPDGEKCSSWHVPPYLFKGAMYKNSEVFCVVREPHDRIVSEYRWRARQGLLKGCSDQSLNTWAQKQVKMLPHQPFHSDCHFVPQINYVWNPKTRQQTCHHVLQMKSLASDFNNLMVNRGYQLRMVRHANAGSACSGLNAAHLWPYTQSMIQHAYKADYALVANPPPPPKGFKPLKPLVSKKKPDSVAKSLVPAAQQVPGGIPSSVQPQVPQKPAVKTKSQARQVKLGAQPDLCLNVFLRGAQAQSGDVLGLWTCAGAFNEELILQKDGTVRLGKQPELCLSIFLRGAGVLDGDQLGMYPCNGGWNQRFISGADGTVRPLGQPDLCVSVVLKQAKANSGDMTGLFKCQGSQGSWNQRFFASSI